VNVGFHPGDAAKGLANFGAGAADFVVSTATLGNLTVPAPFCGTTLRASYDIGYVTGLAETALAGGGEVVASTGRTEAANLTEQLAMEAVQSSDLAAGRVLPLEMTDPRWPASKGWVKMSQTEAGVEIHYVYNTISRVAADFKFVR
jgi:hypothetical protein